MKDVRSSRVLFIFVLLATFVPVLQGTTTLLTENWNSGSINPVVWKQLGNTTAINLENLGGGDYALALRGSQDTGFLPSPASTWNDSIYSQANFARGSGIITVQYKVWYKAGVNVQCAISGGWHYNNTAAHYNNVEATVDYIYSAFRATEASNLNGIQSGPSMTSFNNDWGAANGKASAILVKITLGDVSGAKWEHSNNNGATWILDRDTVGTGNSATVNDYIGFGAYPGQAGTTLIDDIVVSRGVETPPVVPPLPSDIRQLSQHFNTPDNNTAPFIFIPTSNVATVNTSEHRGLAMIREAGNGQDVKGVTQRAIPIGQYTLPWQMQLCIQQAFNVTAGRSANQLNTAIGLNVALTFSNPSTWPTDRSTQPAQTHSFQLLGVHLGNYGETGQGLPQLVTNPNIYRMTGDASPEAYFIYGRGDMGSGQGVQGMWNIPYINIGDGAKYAGPASNQIYYKCEILNSQQIRIGIKFDASHGWNTKVINVSQYGNITGIWEIGPIISADNWIPNTLAPALGITGSPAVTKPDPSFESYVDYCAFLPANPRPLDNYSDEFNIPGYMGQWQIQEQSTVVETYSHPGYLTLMLLGSGCGTGISPEGGPNFSLSTYPPPWEEEVCVITPDDSDPWMFYITLQAYGSNPGNYVIFLPGVKNIPGSGHSFITGVGGNSPFQPQWSPPLTESLLSAKPLYMIFQMLDNSHIRIGFRARPTQSWVFSQSYDTSSVMPGGSIAGWSFTGPATTTGILNGGFGGSANQKILIDYIRYRYGTSNASTVNTACGQEGQVYSPYDVTGPNGLPDCYVDFRDFAAFASSWMMCTDPANSQCVK